MKILIPMAGEGRRFSDAGYTLSKPSIPTYNRNNGKKLPMVVCATLDLPGVSVDGSNVIYVDRIVHRSDGTEKRIRESFPKCSFVTLDSFTEGQACTCLLAEELIDMDDELLIAGCDNGIEYNIDSFMKAKEDCDMLVFTFRHNDVVMSNPNAYGWIIVDEDHNVKGTSIKNAISDNPINDHAVVATFWFKTGKIFITSTRRMIESDDRINGEFYLDQVATHAIKLGYRVKIFEVERYLSWGTPEDYENYQKTYEYWNAFCREEGL